MSDPPTLRPDSNDRLVCRIDGTTVIVEGELDASTALQFDACLHQMGGERTVTVDLGGVTFMDSTALRVLMRFRLESWAEDGSVVLVNVTARTARLFEITGLNQVFRIVEFD